MIVNESTENVNVSNEGISTPTQNEGNTEVIDTKESNEPGLGEKDAPAPYTPNFKYKYAVEGQKSVEAEIDDLFKPLIKDAETEKKVRELFEKAYGLDFIKSDRDTFKTTASDIYSKFQEQSQAINTVSTFIKNKDYDTVFEVLNIPKQDILQYALGIVQYQQMTPEQRAAYDRNIAERQRYAAIEMQNNQIMSEYNNLAATQRENDVANIVNRPEFASIVQNFDNVAGQGAFRNEVVRRGQYYAQVHGIDVPAEQVVREVAQLVGYQQANMQAQQRSMGGTSQNTPNAGVTKPTQKPVLPNISGKGTSPVKKVPRSVDDLRQLAKQLSQ